MDRVGVAKDPVDLAVIVAATESISPPSLRAGACQEKITFVGNEIDTQNGDGAYQTPTRTGSRYRSTLLEPRK